MKGLIGIWPVRILPKRGERSLPSENGQHETVPADDLFLCLRPVLAVGLCLGCFPFGGVLKMNNEKLPTFRLELHGCCLVNFVNELFS